MTIVNTEALHEALMAKEAKLREKMKKYDEMRQHHPEDSKDWNYLLGEIMGLQQGAIEIRLILEEFF